MNFRVASLGNITCMNAATPHKKKSEKLLIFVFGIVVGFTGNWLFLGDGVNFLLGNITEETIFRNDEALEPLIRSEDAIKKPVSLIAQGENTLVTSDQSAGDSVLVSLILINADGWVAIHEGGDGDLSPLILGARRFAAGKYFGERIELLRNTEEGQYYFAVLHADNGDGVFDYETETPLRDGYGDIIKSAFFATSAFSY